MRENSFICVYLPGVEASWTCLIYVTFDSNMASTAIFSQNSDVMMAMVGVSFTEMAGNSATIFTSARRHGDSDADNFKST